MYKFYYNLINEMMTYAKSNRMYQEILFSKKEQLDNYRKKTRTKLAKLLFGILLYIITFESISILIIVIDNNDNKVTQTTFIALGLVFLVISIIGIVSCIMPYMEQITISKLFDKNDMLYINDILKTETKTERLLPFRYKSSHEIIVNFENKDYVLDFDTLDPDATSIKVVSFYRLNKKGFNLIVKPIKEDVITDDRTNN